MTLGPLEYLVIEFEGNHFTGEILPELQALRDRGIVRLVDLVFMQKDMNGNLKVQELSDLSDEEAKPYGPLAGDMLSLLSPEDIEDAASTVPNNSAAAIALLEHVWAVQLKEKILRAHGRFLGEGLVPASEVEALGEEMAGQSAVIHG
jgi:hypothetical protein